MVLKAQTSLFDRPCKKPLKVKSSDVYCGKFHIKYYNFCQQYEDYFATTGAKGPNHIFLQLFSFITTSTSIYSTISESMRLKIQFLLFKKSSKPFFNKA